MADSKTSNNLFLRHVALPSDHGSWVFLLSPLLIGLFAGNSWGMAALFLVVAALAGFLIRQPVTIAVKVFSGRRSRRDLPAAWFWMAVYGFLGFVGLLGLYLQGYGYIFILALPGIPVFSWHLYLVAKRSERRQMGVEIVASGVLALVAPAGYWIGVGGPDLVGWLLFLLTWLQSAASIVYAYLRLVQREWDAVRSVSTRLRKGLRALLYTSFNLILVMLLSVFDFVPFLLGIPYALQWLETIWGTLNPAVGVRPTRIGVRQLIVSSLFTLLFILVW
jgi:hypothetical protein